MHHESILKSSGLTFYYGGEKASLLTLLDVRVDQRTRSVESATPYDIIPTSSVGLYTKSAMSMRVTPVNAFDDANAVSHFWSPPGWVDTLASANRTKLRTDCLQPLSPESLDTGTAS
jgi:hypothetical protein